MPDLEQGYLKSRPVLALLVAVAVAAVYLSPYLTGAEEMKAHIKEHPAEVLAQSNRDNAQDNAIALMAKDIEAGEAHRKRVEGQIKTVIEHLDRLQLVSTGPDPPDKSKQIANLLEKY